MDDQDLVIEIHAICELTEANVPPRGGGDAWDTEVRFLQQNDREGHPSPLQEAIDAVLDDASTLA